MYSVDYYRITRGISEVGLTSRIEGKQFIP